MEGKENGREGERRGGEGVMVGESGDEENRGEKSMDGERG